MFVYAHVHTHVCMCVYVCVYVPAVLHAYIRTHMHALGLKLVVNSVLEYSLVFNPIV